MNKDEIITQLRANKLVAIIRGAQPGDVLEIGKALYEGGVKCLEITLNSPNALFAIESIAKKMEGRLIIGAGTVLTAAEAHAAVRAGARFIISPVFSTEVIEATRQAGAVSIPGAYTPTEIFNAYASGGDIIKVFPGSAGPGFIKEVLAPLPHIPMMPTGGISLDNIDTFKKAGAVAFGIGKSLVDTSQKINGNSLQQIVSNAQKFVQAVAS